MIPVLAVPDVQAHEVGRARPHRHVEDVGAGAGGGVSHMLPVAMQEDHEEDREEAEAEIVARGCHIIGGLVVM